MKGIYIKSLSVIISILIILSVVPFPVYSIDTNSYPAGANYDWSYRLEDNNHTLIITGTGDLPNKYDIYNDIYGYGITKVVIEEGITGIGNENFSYFESLTSVSIADSVTYIGTAAFHHCTALTDIRLSDNLTSIGDSAFNWCTELTEINFSDKLRSIGDSTFYGCKNLTSITVPDGVTEIGKNAFRDCTSLNSVFIPDSVTEIGEYTFYNCSKLSEVRLSSNLTKIENSIFEECSKLNSIIIPSGVTEIGTHAFHGCSMLDVVVIPDSVTVIKDYAFIYCSLLGASQGSIKLPENLKSIGRYAISSCKSLESIIIPYGVESIGEYAFLSCSLLKNISIPKSVTSIGTDALKTQSELTAHVIANSYAEKYVKDNNIPYISYPEEIAGTTGECNWILNCNGTLTISGNGEMGDYDQTYTNGTWITAAPWGANMKSVVIEDGVTRIGYSAFYGCTGLVSVTIPNSVTSIEWYAFCDCTGLTSVTIPDSVTIIDAGVFNGCTGLTSIKVSTANCIFDSRDNCNAIIETATNTLVCGCKKTVIPKSVTSIGRSAFSGCTSLTSMTIPDSVTSISNHAFSDCTGLSSVTIPDSVTSIGDYAFSRCTGLTSVTIPDSVTTIGDQAFSDCTGLTSVTIPDSVTSIGGAAFSGCTGLTSITIPDSVTSIGGSAFYNTPWYNNLPNGLIYAGKVVYEYKGTMPNNTAIDILPGTKGIAGNAFSSCKGLVSVTIPSGVTTIGTSAFIGCTGLKSVLIPDSVTTIGNRAFFACTGLTSVNIPNNVTNIGEYAFRGCTGLTGITIPDSVTSIGHGAFYDTPWYNHQPDGLIYAGKVAYEYKGTMPNNTAIDILPGTKEITASAFYECVGLKSVSIPDSVTSIGREAFRGCTNLTCVAIPDSVTSIGSYALGYYYDDVYKKIDGFTIYGSPYSEAERYADSNGFLFKAGGECPHCHSLLLIEEMIKDAAVPATCTETGLTAGSHCSVCGGILEAQEVIPASGHSVVIDKAIAPTCTETGLTEGSHCSVCHAILKAQEVIPANGHSVVIDKAVAPTCTATGLTEGSHCSVCHEILKAQEIIPAKGHTPVTDKGYPATLSDTGLTDGSHCSVCGKVLEQQQVIPVSGYVMVAVGSVSEIFGIEWNCYSNDNIMTENADGTYTIEYTVNKSYQDVQVKVAKRTKNDALWYGDENKNSIDFSLTGAGTFTVTATPSTNGYIVSVSGDNVKIMTDLEYSAVYAVGNGEGSWLNGASWDPCDKSNSMTEIVDGIWEIEYKNVSAESCQLKFAIDGSWRHNFGGYYSDSGVVTDAVYDSDNICFETKGHCTVRLQLDLRNFNYNTKLGAKFTITIICYHDSIKTENGYSADCTHDGLTDRKVCKICGTVLAEHKVIPATGHTEMIDNAKSPTCTETGLTEGSHCSVCGEVIKAQEIIPATGHTEVTDEAKAPTCTETGLTEGSHCSVCGEIIKAQEVIPATGHTWDNGTVTKAADCHHEGEMTYRCSECHEKRTEVIPMLEHQWDDGTITKEPTYTEPGEVKYTCSLCGDTRTEPVPCKEKKGKLTISNETVRAGDEVTVKLYLDENPGITALSININFPNEFILKDVQYMGLFPNQPSSSPMNYNPFTISWASPTSTDIDNTGLFAVLTFDVGIDVPLADYPITVTYNAENVFDSAFVNVPLDIENGTVSVLKPTPGDVNRDGNINMKDLVLIQQLINRWDVQIVESAADVTDDGEINMKDLVLLQRYINGWEVVLK